MLDQLRARLGHDPQAERAVVREELLKITRLRLARLLGWFTATNAVLGQAQLDPMAAVRSVRRGRVRLIEEQRAKNARCLGRWTDERTRE